MGGRGGSPSGPLPSAQTVEVLVLHWTVWGGGGRKSFRAIAKSTDNGSANLALDRWGGGEEVPQDHCQVHRQWKCQSCTGKFFLGWVGGEGGVGIPSGSLPSTQTLEVSVLHRRVRGLGMGEFLKDHCRVHKQWKGLKDNTGQSKRAGTHNCSLSRALKYRRN